MTSLDDSDWGLVRAKRDWVPGWLWRLFCIGNLATFTPFKEALTRRSRRS